MTELAGEVSSLQQLSFGISQAELADLSAYTAKKLAAGLRVRAVLIAESPEHLQQLCSELLNLLDSPDIKMPVCQPGMYAGIVWPRNSVAKSPLVF